MGVNFFGVRAWLGAILGEISIIYFRGLEMRVRVWVRVRVRASVVLCSGFKSLGLWSELGLV